MGQGNGVKEGRGQVWGTARGAVVGQDRQGRYMWAEEWKTKQEGLKVML